MLKSLNNQSKKMIILKLKFKNFIKYQLWQYLIVFSSLVLCAWFFNRWIECVMLCIAHTCIRNAFDKQFHFNSAAYCLMLTSALIWSAIPITLPICSSILSSIPIAFVVCFIGFIAQDRVDRLVEIQRLKKELKELLAKINHEDIYAMSEDELYEHCRDCGLSEEDCRIAYFIVIERLKGRELYDAIGYSERQTKRKRAKILDTIK